MNVILFRDLTESDVVRLADEIAFFLQPGDTLCLEGDLGTGKSTFARALIRTLSNDPALDVPSPTFTLTQSYEATRFEIAHFDLYRLTDPSELDELGLEAALARGIAVIEWPSHGGGRIPAEHLALNLSEGRAEHLRTIELSASPGFIDRLERFAAIREFLASAGWGASDIRVIYLQGDASPRRYARLTKPDGAHALLVDSPRRPDGPPIRDGKPYSAIAHLAEDVTAFVAIGDALRKAGISTPEIFAQDLDRGLLIIEDFGDKVFGSEIVSGADQKLLWQRATDSVVALQSTPPPQRMALSDGTTFILPQADEAVLDIETQLLLDWYWPAIYGKPAPQSARDEFTSEWHSVFSRVLQQPPAWLLRDYHSPNLIALDERTSPRDVGIIDFQDAMSGPAAYDLVSLLQDARVTVPVRLEKDLLDRYIAAMKKRDTAFDETEFLFCYAALGAQRNTKILGIFARLAMRDGKRRYLAHLPRIWGYLERDLAHEGLQALRAWYDRNLPAKLRTQSLTI
ncbi:tRNA (adenosine(37)-N6)-threonylcarbamoyltransferase complex ATPase subunit type 1 TsaE [Hyphomicrobium sp.]|jgi:tRNA threonylcarbamoyl adenosine modification protein YjeE|uniref:tRNA (adenosine(37)-N6)-threonylcarbamoyltransferase complex ATPase subunit type 1 TsaE n=1 Tax=Hyphomicrobium sp. TaxID=82 RepID=UPI002C99EB0A|nr:tRNA (adenosine(37)-N6)-threonylcarbamoyltransferase complex ATPase subunit type 1 TsaE [Hyphomicrobium sp.]HVZ05728.1 tRNA (adenosine(37)-N6)-threonylcarbamoyltransferase complex ATPase subunit type 1 TsaE [Hyphomicrobium sp.]